MSCHDCVACLVYNKTFHSQNKTYHTVKTRLTTQSKQDILHSQSKTYHTVKTRHSTRSKMCGMSCFDCVVCNVLTVWYVLFWLCGMSYFDCVVSESQREKVYSILLNWSKNCSHHLNQYGVNIWPGEVLFVGMFCRLEFRTSSVVCLDLTVWYVLFGLCGMFCLDCVVCLVLIVWYVMFWLCGMSCFDCVVCLILTSEVLFDKVLRNIRNLNHNEKKCTVYY
jgi:hypothetical protein